MAKRFFENERGILFNGDCREVLPKIPDETVDLVVTDPPYGVGSKELNGIGYVDKFYDVEFVAKELFRITKNNSRAFVFSAQKTAFSVIEGFTKAGFKLHQVLVWFRPNLVGSTKKKTYDFTSVHEFILNFHKGKPPKLKKVQGFNNFDVLNYPQPQSNFKDKRVHVHQKPIKLIEHLIAVSTSENDLVLDCFAGSGTTAVACEKLNRKWICVEVEEEYCKIAKERIEKAKQSTQQPLPLTLPFEKLTR